jgi:hypothetical protein
MGQIESASQNLLEIDSEASGGKMKSNTVWGKIGADHNLFFLHLCTSDT